MHIFSVFSRRQGHVHRKRLDVVFQGVNVAFSGEKSIQSNPDPSKIESFRGALHRCGGLTRVSFDRTRSRIGVGHAQIALVSRAGRGLPRNFIGVHKICGATGNARFGGGKPRWRAAPWLPVSETEGSVSLPCRVTRLLLNGAVGFVRNVSGVGQIGRPHERSDN